jgi:hypothetical protein
MEDIMLDTGKTLYSLQKFMVLQTKLNPQTTNLLPDSYVYAWYVDLYPFLDDCEWHTNLKDFFSIKESKIDPIWDYLIKEWELKRNHTFYDLENYFGVEHQRNEISRSDLIHILRYAYLLKNFNDNFWQKLLEPMKYPSEASIITYDFDVSQLYFV